MVAAWRCRLRRGTSVDAAKSIRGRGARAREVQHDQLHGRCLLVFVCSALCASCVTVRASLLPNPARAIVLSGPRACGLRLGARRVEGARPTSWRPMVL